MASVLFEWEGIEYEHSPKSADWYWALGILATAAFIAAILFQNYLFAAVILAGTFAIVLHSLKRPPVHQFKLLEHGLQIGDELHGFDEMLSFSVVEDIEGGEPPLLSIKTRKWLSPHLIIPLSGVDPDGVYTYFLAHVEQGEHKPTFSDAVALWLGF